MTHRPPFRAEHIGSLLRPRALKDAFGAHARGAIGRLALDQAIDGAIIDAILLQETCGLHVVTDGEFRRGSWFLGFVDAIAGLTTAPSTFAFTGAHAAWQCPYAERRLEPVRGIATDEFEFVRTHTDRTPKMTLPSPTAMHFWRGRDAYAPGAYRDLDDYFADLARIYRQELIDLAAVGCVYVQLDEVPIAMLCDPAVRDAVAARGHAPDALLRRYVALVNEALADRPGNMVVGMHLCRGNYKGQWMASGGYAPVAELLFGGLDVNAFFLEYDSPRAGGFEPLAALGADKVAVLGLVTTKSTDSPSADELRRQIEAAAAFVPLDRLAISPQCGFASSVAGNPVTEADERAKLALVAEVARTVWPGSPAAGIGERRR
jgi:5-methyltetrahydropteroyltriglutamate--homocysteine methyltransferase